MLNLANAKNALPNDAIALTRLVQFDEFVEMMTGVAAQKGKTLTEALQLALPERRQIIEGVFPFISPALDEIDRQLDITRN